MTAVADLRRGWCPSVLRPMPTGDGLLVRLHPPGGALGAAQARAVAEAARACGNGLLDVTGRGNLQIRGVREETHADLVERLIRTFPLQESAPDPSPSGEGRLARSASGAGAPTPSAIDRVEHGPDAPTRLGLRPSPPSPEGEGSARPVPQGRSPGSAYLMPPFPNGGPVRLTIVSPLAGLDPTDLLDAGALAERIEAESRVEGLPPKTGVVVDGGGAWTLDGIAADLRLVAIGTRTAPALAIGIGIGAPVEWLGTTTPAAAPATVRTLLGRFAVLLGRSPVRRLKELPAGLRSELVAGLDLAPAVAPPARAPGPRAGAIALGERQTAFLAGLPFGRCDADHLALLARLSERSGTGVLRLSPSRGIALPGIARADLPALAGDVHAAGLIVDPDDPRLAVAACPGRPACGRATTDTHADAARLAAAARPLIASGAAIHVSGCPKGCAHAGAADLTLVGEAGAYRVVVRGSARDPGGAPQRLEAILAQLHAGSPP